MRWIRFGLIAAVIWAGLGWQPGAVSAAAGCAPYRYYLPLLEGAEMSQSAFEHIEGLVKRPASMPYDGIIAEVFPDQVSVRKVANNQILQRVTITDHIDRSKLKKGIPVRLGEHLGQPILLAILPQLEGDINYAGKGSIIPSPPTVSVAGTANGWLVTWTPVAGADRYRVYRNDTPDETTPDDLEYVTGTSTLVPYESPYIYFAVRACSGLNESELSGWVTDAVPPLTPDTFVALNDLKGHQLIISPFDLSMTHPGFRYFEIEQANDDIGTGAVSLGYFYYPDQFPSLQVFGVGTVKYYRIRAIDWAGNMSDWTAWDIATSGWQELQDKFDGYGGSSTSPLDSLWWLKMANFDTSETWTVGEGTLTTETTTYKEGNAGRRLTMSAFFGADARRSVSLDLSNDGRFGDDDYVVIPIYVSVWTPPNAFLNIVFLDGGAPGYYQKLITSASVGWNYFKYKKSDFTVGTGTPNWNNITSLEVYAYLDTAGYIIVDDWRIVKADPDDATTYNDTGPAWDRTANTGTDFGEWHIYDGNRAGEPAKPFSYGQIKTAASPAAWYLSHKPLATTQIVTGTIQAGLYLKGANGKAGLAFFIKDVTPGSWDMYAIEADSAGDTIKLVKWVGGTRTEIASASFTFGPDQMLWLGADFKDYDAGGGRIKVYASFSEGNLLQAANLKISAQDTAIGIGGSVGLLSYQANVRFVNALAGSPEHADTADVAFALDGPILAGETRRVRYDRDGNEWQWSDDGSTWAGVRPVVASGNYVITPSVASNNLTVALKTLAGADPSASDPIVTRIGNGLVTIAAALSTTKTAGTNWFNSGAAGTAGGMAANAIDYFVYLINETGAGAGVKVGFARIPWARTMGDFTNTTTSEKYIAGNWTNFNSTDPVTVIGRFRATLSGTAAFNWSAPGTVVNYPIYETDWLTHSPTPSSGSGSITTIGTVTAVYQLIGRNLVLSHDITITTVGTAGAGFNVPIPFTVASLSIGPGRERAVGGKMLQGIASGATINYNNYDNSSVFSTGNGLIVAGGGSAIRIG